MSVRGIATPRHHTLVCQYRASHSHTLRQHRASHSTIRHVSTGHSGVGRQGHVAPARPSTGQARLPTGTSYAISVPHVA
eukprot:3941653-Rhodomonas_salina.6